MRLSRQHNTERRSNTKRVIGASAFEVLDQFKNIASRDLDGIANCSIRVTKVNHRDLKFVKCSNFFKSFHQEHKNKITKLFIKWRHFNGCRSYLFVDQYLYFSSIPKNIDRGDRYFLIAKGELFNLISMSVLP